MKKLRNLMSVVFIAVFLTSCATNKAVYIDPQLNFENAAKIIVYRPSSEWMGLANDFRVSLNGNFIGSLKTGKHIESFSAPGENDLTVADYFLGIEGKPFTTKLVVEKGKTYYVRFSQHIDDMIILPGSGGYMSSHSELQPATKEQWEDGV
jgi:hypothetical protein